MKLMLLRNTEQGGGLFDVGGSGGSVPPWVRCSLQRSDP